MERVIERHLHDQSSSNSNASSGLKSSVDCDGHDPSLVSGDVDIDEKDFILTQDFFCTPDYITPKDQDLQSSFDWNMGNSPCPKSPEKLNTTKTKKPRLDLVPVNRLSPTLFGQQTSSEFAKEASALNGLKIEEAAPNGTEKFPSYVSKSAAALRCRVMPPPCIKNPFLMDNTKVDVDPFSSWRSKCAGLFPSMVGGEGLSRYHTDFHEIQQIGAGNFSRVFKVLKRIDGFLYAVKHCTRQLHRDAERRKALIEVQALAALGCHEHIVSYYSSWFENEQLYIQMELCDGNLSVDGFSRSFTEGEVLNILYQIAKALQFIHSRGIAHLDVKPDNIYVKNGVYKLGDFGCATLLDQNLPIEEGDARYMPQEVLNENYDHLDKVDVFSLGAVVYELIRRSPLPESGSLFLNLKEGKLPLFPGYSLQFQNLLKAMVDPDPVCRPSSKELVGNPIFNKYRRHSMS